jgi:hypothetical protein|tara:strand:- start:1853 stop:2032 length:180 start_codon:yes stop_codon:yes gene_type:complete
VDEISGDKMTKNKGLGFWIGIVLIVLSVLQLINLGILSNYASKLMPLAGVAAGIYLLIK